MKNGLDLRENCVSHFVDQTSLGILMWPIRLVLFINFNSISYHDAYLVCSDLDTNTDSLVYQYQLLHLFKQEDFDGHSQSSCIQNGLHPF